MNTKYIITMGLNDRCTKQQKFTMQESYQYAESILQANTDGYSITEQKGGYKHTTGEFIREISFKIELVFISEHKVFEIINELKSTFNQEAIILEIIQCNSKLI